MGKYGESAVRAVRLYRDKKFATPNEAWQAAVEEFLPGKIPSQVKTCPRNAFLGLCDEGLVVGIPGGTYSNSSENKSYAIKAVRLLQRRKKHDLNKPSELWELVMDGDRKTPNDQMDVVLGLWRQGLIST